MTASGERLAIAHASVNHLSAERAQRLIDLLLAMATDQAGNGDLVSFDMRLYVYIETTTDDALARVAELEAAQQWQPGTAKPPGPAWYFVYDLRDDDTPLRRYHNGAAWGLPGEEEEPPDWWLPIPPLPQETTP